MPVTAYFEHMNRVHRQAITCEREALEIAVWAIGGAKQAAAVLAQSESYVRDRIKQNARHRFSDEERARLIRLSCEAGLMAPAEWIAEQWGCKVNFKSPAQELDALEREQAALAARAEAVRRRAAELSAKLGTSASGTVTRIAA